MTGDKNSMNNMLVIVIVCLLGKSCYSQTTGDTCDEDWTLYNGSCYTLSEYISMNFTKAQRQCLALNSSLVSIGSSQEQLFIDNTLSSFKNEPNRVWIGLKNSETDGWVWTDGTPLSYTNWIGAEHGSDERAFMILSDGSWHWIRVSIATGGYSRAMCEKPAYEPKRETAFSSPTVQTKQMVDELTNDSLSSVTTPKTLPANGTTLKPENAQTFTTKETTDSETSHPKTSGNSGYSKDDVQLVVGTTVGCFCVITAVVTVIVVALKIHRKHRKCQPNGEDIDYENTSNIGVTRETHVSTSPGQQATKLDAADVGGNAHPASSSSPDYETVEDIDKASYENLQNSGQMSTVAYESLQSRTISEPSEQGYRALSFDRETHLYERGDVL